MVDFRKSLEASWRRYLRSAVRLSYMTKGQKAVTLALLNVWLHHRNGPKGYIHPGRVKIAKSAMVTEKTVSRTMSVLRACGVLRVRRRLHGEGQRPTEYTMSMIPLLELCGAEIPEWTPGELVEMRHDWASNGPRAPGQMSHHSSAKCPTTGGTKCPTVYSDVETPPKGKPMHTLLCPGDGHE